MKKIWIVVADKKEIPDIHFIIKNKLKPFDIEFHACGIGLFDSFYGFTTLLNQTDAKHQPDGVLLVGTAGSPKKEDLFKVSFTNRFMNPQFNVEELPEFLLKEWTTTHVEGLNYKFKSNDDILNMPVYSTFGISTSGDHLAASMSEAWENMEALSLSFVCMKRQIPFDALLCCTNQICRDGRKQWKQNYIKAGEILFEALHKLLSS